MEAGLHQEAAVEQHATRSEEGTGRGDAERARRGEHERHEERALQRRRPPQREQVHLGWDVHSDLVPTLAAVIAAYPRDEAEEQLA